ncbi:uncharacterized protein LOC122505672 [Leptopilina heterotoma]|uniref:uncharacterized protein LOC122505672 n=1 Tax=Leptopilina heterotoma TaxID=63436 RepID=UPI001CA7C2F6|nr:uncharacterized protein LOC122505672 [Leptopilina heterotoma]XP_043473386.1 uncharacterized protein LOC122505672 [Leptopilina heterotoma]
MESTKRNPEADQLPIPTSDAAEVKALQFTPEGNCVDKGKLEFQEVPTGLVALTKFGFDALIAERNTLFSQLTEATKSINELRREVTSAATTPYNAVISDQACQITQLNEKCNGLSDRLATAEEKLKSSQQLCAQHKADVDSYAEDYYYLEGLYKRLRRLFKDRIQEVYVSLTELREPRLRPKAPPGCLNCGVIGHNFRSCPKEYSGQFCQICSHPDFSTED